MKHTYILIISLLLASSQANSSNSSTTVEPSETSDTITSKGATLALLPLINDNYIDDQQLHFGRNYYSYLMEDSVWGISSFASIPVDGEWLYEGFQEGDEGSDEDWYLYYNKRGELVRKYRYSYHDNENIYWADNKRDMLYRGKNRHGKYVSYKSLTPDRDIIYSYLFHDEIASDTLICLDFDDFYTSRYRRLSEYIAPVAKSDSAEITALIRAKLPPFPIAQLNAPTYKNITRKELKLDTTYSDELMNYDNEVHALFIEYITHLVKNSKQPTYLYSSDMRSKEELMADRGPTFHLLFENLKLAIETNAKDKEWKDLLTDLPMYFPTREKAPQPQPDANISLTEVDKDAVGWVKGTGRLNIGRPEYMYQYQLICNQDTFQLANQNKLSIHNTHLRDDNSAVITLSISTQRTSNNCIFVEYMPHK